MKYTFEIMKEYEDAFKGISVYSVSDDKKLMVDFVALEELEDAQKEIDEAYQRGVEDGRNESWEAARKIIHMPEGDLLNIFTECYSAVCTALQVLLKYDASESIEKLKAYEEKQKADNKIEVGDEVEVLKTGTKYLIAWISGSLICGFSYAGITCRFQPSDVRKTGRHFDIDKILEAMKK